MNKIIEILENMKPGIDFTKETYLITNGILTSMEIVQLVMELNEEFDIEISPMDIIPENFESVTAINQLVEKCLDE
ncbi:MAG: phosphopantetheine-binding protein [Bacilli bacterium]|nr:phosphopantetheine-binding protein [Mollicutes bacterium]MDY3899602.1 phosphopantetheine-binding protein [Bacilli bacterium]